jgi:hypothetical protein
MICKDCIYSKWEVSDTSIDNIGYCVIRKKFIVDDRDICRDYDDETNIENYENIRS